MKWVLALFLLCTPLMAQSVSFTGTNAGAVPDGTSSTPGNYGAPRTMNFSVTGLSLNVRTVAVVLDITHSWIGDLDVVLAGPGGTPSLVVFSRVGATTALPLGDDSAVSGAYSFFDNNTGNLWSTAQGTSGTVPVGNYRSSTAGPNGGTITSMDAVFRGMTPGQANGTWTLAVRDGCAAITGTVNGASLLINTGPYVTSSSPTSGNEAGGTIVTINGANFVPGSTGVTFGGITATGTVTSTQIQAVAPAHAPGVVDIVITTASGGWTILGGFTYTTGSGGGGGGDGGDDGGCTTCEGLGMPAIVTALAILLAVRWRRLRRS